MVMTVATVADGDGDGAGAKYWVTVHQAATVFMAYRITRQTLHTSIISWAGHAMPPNPILYRAKQKKDTRILAAPDSPNIN
jgi:hypothetical protein